MRRTLSDAGPGSPAAEATTQKDKFMRFMVIVKATEGSEKGTMQEKRLLASMAAYHEELMKAGVLLDASGLQPSSKSWRVKYSGGKRTVIDGPFHRDQGAYRRLYPHPGEVEGRRARMDQTLTEPRGEGADAEIEVRQLFELDDFGPGDAVDRFRDIEASQK